MRSQDSSAPRSAAPGIGGEEGIAGAAGQNDDAAFAEMVQRRLPGKGFAERGHRHGGKRPRALALLLDGVFERERVHDGREHADRIGARPLDAFVRAGDAAKEIAAADDHRDLDAERRGLRQVGGDPRQRPHVEAVAFGAHQRLAGKFDDDPPPRRRASFAIK